MAADCHSELSELMTEAHRSFWSLHTHADTYADLPDSSTFSKGIYPPCYLFNATSSAYPCAGCKRVEDKNMEKTKEAKDEIVLQAEYSVIHLNDGLMQFLRLVLISTSVDFLILLYFTFSLIFNSLSLFSPVFVPEK